MEKFAVVRVVVLLEFRDGRVAGAQCGMAQNKRDLYLIRHPKSSRLAF
jgi:hypothetical protein